MVVKRELWNLFVKVFITAQMGELWSISLHANVLWEIAQNAFLSADKNAVEIWTNE